MAEDNRATVDRVLTDLLARIRDEKYDIDEFRTNISQGTPRMPHTDTPGRRMLDGSISFEIKVSLVNTDLRRKYEEALQA